MLKEFMEADPERKLKIMVDFESGLTGDFSEIEESIEQVSDKEGEMLMEAVKQYDSEIYEDIWETERTEEEADLEEGKYNLEVVSDGDFSLDIVNLEFYFEGDLILTRKAKLDFDNNMCYFIWEFAGGDG